MNVIFHQTICIDLHFGYLSNSLQHILKVLIVLMIIEGLLLVGSSEHHVLDATGTLYSCCSRHFTHPSSLITDFPVEDNSKGDREPSPVSFRLSLHIFLNNFKRLIEKSFDTLALVKTLLDLVHYTLVCPMQRLIELRIRLIII